jgi:preprotein translocase subunit SecF
MEWFKPGSHYDFMKASRFWVPFSVSLAVLSIIAALVFGFDSGIDFKGGTKVIASFKASAKVDRKDIKSTVDALVEQQTGQKGTQVEVQDFDVGAGSSAETVKYQIFTELPSLLTPLKKLEVAKAVERHFGAGTATDTPAESGDRFYVTLPDEWPLDAVAVEVRKVMAAQGFPSVLVRSDKEDRIRSDMLREKDLLLSAKDDDVKAEAARVENDATTKIASIKDARFTIEVQAIRDSVTGALKGKFGDSFVEVLSTSSVSPAVGKELFQTAMLALFYAIIGILIYVALRFDLRFAPGAIICLIHDVAVVFGVMVVFDIKFTLPVVAALLTIIGYDINDTIVVYDRIRETLAKGKPGDLTKTINEAVNETLSRTIMTGIATMASLILIAFLGGATIRDFAILLLVGVVLGTYSSIFVAAPLTIWIDKITRRRSRASAAARA